MSHTKVALSVLALALSGVPAAETLAHADLPCAPLAALPAPAPAPSPAAAPAPAHARRHAGLLEESLAHLSLRPDQRAKITAIAASIGPSRLATRDARRALLEALAAEIERGAVDARALRRYVDAAVNAEASERATERAALEQLHGILDREQRVDLSRTMESRLVAWQPHETRAGELRRLTAELKLSHAQRAKVAAVLRAEPIPRDVAPRAAKAEEQRVAEAFKADAFVMEHIVRDDTRAVATARLQRFVALTDKVTRLLSTEQHRLCADKLRARAAHGVIGL